MSKSSKIRREEFEEFAGRLDSDLQFLRETVFEIAAFAATTHQLETFEFKNTEGVTVNDLRVKFDNGRVQTKDKGPFRKASTSGKTVTLEGGPGVADGDKAKITFERNGAFAIVGWQWTVDGKPQGGPKAGPPGP